jgi:hypothetical protein
MIGCLLKSEPSSIGPKSTQLVECATSETEPPCMLPCLQGVTGLPTTQPTLLITVI